MNFPLSQIWENPRAGSRQKIRISLTEAATLEIRNNLPRGKQGTQWRMGRAPRASYGEQLVQTVTWRLENSDWVYSTRGFFVQGPSLEAPSSSYYIIFKKYFCRRIYLSVLWIQQKPRAKACHGGWHMQFLYVERHDFTSRGTPAVLSEALMCVSNVCSAQ